MRFLTPAQRKRLLWAYRLCPASPWYRAARARLCAARPLVSILVPTFNRADMIGPAVESLLAQSWRHIEVLVIDDGSTDETPAVVEGLARRDERVRPLRLPANVGTYAALNHGLAAAQGQFFTTHGSDDRAHRRRVEVHLLPFFAAPAPVATATDYIRAPSDRAWADRRRCLCLMIDRARMLEAVGGYDPVRRGGDFELYERLKVAFGPRAVTHIPRVLYYALAHAGSLTSDSDIAAGHLSAERQAYIEHFRAWHAAELAAGRLPHRPLRE
ncbi:MAG TPA: hypothetical protein DDX54_05380 [Rhodospirillaceae bacterium]|jgi:glycosyltransferase involved in cell wall biosynthesis|nr:glycosyltransferase [Alphaproteobacteria bacterium]HBH26814.1 hypothetical protein [Rhodospirillaceae bacterium]